MELTARRGEVAIHHARTGDAPRFVYPVDIVRWRSCAVAVSGVFGPEIAGRSPLFRPGDVTCECFWRDRWWNVIAGYDGDTGDLRGYYCNIAYPPQFIEGDAPRVSYVDLDLDILVFPDGTTELHDEDEFARYREQFAYPAETVARAWQTVNDVTARIRRRAHPFRFAPLPALLRRLRPPECPPLS